MGRAIMVVAGLPPNDFKYMAIYELDTDDVEGATQAERTPE